MTRTMHVFVIAGEPSGDQLGAHLMAGLKSLVPDVTFTGVGGSGMTSEGLDSMFDMNELSVMGFVEVLPRLPALLRRIKEVSNRIIAERPDILVTIDSPDFCLRVARKARAEFPALNVSHYVAPSVWAWRPERAAKMSNHVDHVLALLPFEPPFMEKAGMTCDFVGHPAATFPVITDAEKQEFRRSHGIGLHDPVLCMLPGSRRSEISHHSRIFRECLQVVSEAIPGVRTVVPVAPNVADLVQVSFANSPTNPVFLHPGNGDRETELRRKLTAFAAADAALAVSGTVSLELASQATPMVIAYTTGKISQWIIKKKYLLDTATLVNLVSDTRAVPEFIFDNFRTDQIAPALIEMLKSPLAAKDQLVASQVTMAALGRGGEAPGLRAARSLLNQFG